MVQPRQRRLEAKPWVREPAGEAFKQHKAERVDIARRSDVAAFDLLRAEVVGRAHRRAVLGEPWAVNRPGDAEVGELRNRIVEQDVRRLDVAMDDTAAMDVVEGGSDLRADRGGLRRSERPVREPLRKGRSWNKFQNQVRSASNRKSFRATGRPSTSSVAR
ncbi:MAG TPA: hypothetical protein VGJ59_12035 [Jatrophihabitantaceae bacterium]